MPALARRYSDGMSEENLQVVRRVAEAFQEAAAAGDFRNLDLIEEGLVDPDFEWVPASEVPLEETYEGAKEFAAFMETWTEDFDRWTFEIERFIDADNEGVVVIVRQMATGKSSGAPVDLRWGMQCELRDGRVIRMKNFLDPTKALEAAGLSG